MAPSRPSPAFSGLGPGLSGRRNVVRDLERLREKHQISLDDRQAAALALFALLLLCGVFAIGVMLGKRLARVSTPPPGLAQLDEAAQRPSPSPAPAPAARAPAPAAHASEPLAHAPEAAHAGKSALPEPVAAPHEDAARKLSGDAPHAVVPSPPRAPVVVPPPKPVQVASLVPAAASPPPRDLGQFTVQLGASQDKADAQRLEARARAAGLKPYVMEADLGRRGLWYRVRVGSFSDKEAAGRFRKDVERELGSKAVVMATR